MVLQATTGACHICKRGLKIDDNCGARWRTERSEWLDEADGPSAVREGGLVDGCRSNDSEKRIIRLRIIRLLASESELQMSWGVDCGSRGFPFWRVVIGGQKRG